MAMNFLEFEQPIAELEAKIEELKFLGQGRERQYLGGDQAAAIEEPGAHQQHFRQPLALANHAAGAPSSASLYARLRVHDLHRLARVARRPHVQRRSGHRRRPGAARGYAGHADRPPEGPRHQGAGAAQLRHAQARGLSQGAAPDDDGGAVSHSGHHPDRYARALIPASARKSAARARPSRAICSRCRIWRRRC